MCVFSWAQHAPKWELRKLAGLAIEFPMTGILKCRGLFGGPLFTKTTRALCFMSHSVNSLNGGYVGDYMGDY